MEYEKEKNCPIVDEMTRLAEDIEYILSDIGIHETLERNPDMTHMYNGINRLESCLDLLRTVKNQLDVLNADWWNFVENL